MRATIVFVMFMLVCAAGCGRSPGGTPKRQLVIFCGSSMIEPMNEISRTFAEERRVNVTTDTGGSETLLPRVLAGAAADVFVCHDPFEQKVREAGRWAGSATVATMRPVILVKPGNPHNITKVEDLAREGLKIGIGNPEYSTAGRMFVEMLQRRGLYEQVMKQVVLQARTHQEIANGLIVGPLDVAVVWNFISVLYKDKVQVVHTDDRYDDVRVTVVGLTNSPNPQMRDLFLEECRTQRVRDVFARHGYSPVSP